MAQLKQFINDLGFLAEGEPDPNSSMPPSGDGMVGVDEPVGGGDVLRQLPGDMGGLPSPKPAQSSETSRDRAQLRKPKASSGINAAPKRPAKPTPSAGFQSAPGGVVPFDPMPEPSGDMGLAGGLGAGGGGGSVIGPISEAGGGAFAPAPAAISPISGGTSHLRGLLGAQGGLMEGGLGLGFDPVADEKSDPIKLLLEQLVGR